MPNTSEIASYDELRADLDARLDRFAGVWSGHVARPLVEEVGHVVRVEGPVAEVTGLPDVQSEELVEFDGSRLGLAADLSPGRVGVVLLDDIHRVRAGDPVRRTGRVMSVPVGVDLIGRVIDPTGRPLDGAGPVAAGERLPIERPAPSIMERGPVEAPLQTGIKVIDALVPIGRGQRELILGDRQTGKTSIAVDTMINQAGRDVVCVYCAIGLRSSAVAKVVADLREHGSMRNTIVVVTTGDDSPGRQFIAPYAATSIAEHLRDLGRDVLIVYDDLTRHARAYRELSLLLRRPPGREAYPGDIFYIHSRLLERPAKLATGASITALPIIETQSQDMSGYISTNLISITDGQIYLSPKLFQQGVLPAVDVGRSVSRIGGRAQLPAYRTVTGDLRLSYAQFEELERFSRYGARLERERMRRLERGRRVREVLKQGRYAPMRVAEQVAALAAVTGGVFDSVPAAEVEQVSGRVAREVVDRMRSLFAGVSRGERLGPDDLEGVRDLAHRIVATAE